MHIWTEICIFFQQEVAKVGFGKVFLPLFCDKPRKAKRRERPKKEG